MHISDQPSNPASMSGILVHSESELVRRIRAKFEKLEEVCTQRYQGRETRVLGTINYGVSTLEQLQSWASFSLFAPDERNSDKYVQFIEYKYLAVMGPLRNYRKELEKSLPPSMQQAVLTPGQTPRGSPRPPSSTGSSPRTGESPRSLKERISKITQQYIDEGHEIRNMTLLKFQKCRKDIRTMYRWSQASLMDLHEVFDEALADELYFLARGKLARIMSTVSVLEDACEQIEKNLQQQIPNNMGMGQMGAGVPNPQDRPVSAMAAMQSAEPTPGGAGSGEPSPRLVQVPARSVSPPLQTNPSPNPLSLHGLDELEIQFLEDKLAQSFSSSSRFNSLNASLRSDPGGQGNLSSSQNGHIFSDSSASTSPEPPTSPRPKGLVNHPKIMKDRLQTFSLPNRFMNTRMANTW